MEAATAHRVAPERAALVPDPLLVLLHSLIDLGAALRPVHHGGGGDVFNLGAVIVTLPLAIYGLVLLRRRADERPGGGAPAIESS